jgi:hypothetical protein
VIVDRGGPWVAVPTFRRALEVLQSVLTSMEVPLVFSNGDYNPLNFLHVGQRITGWIDFGAARFEDPYIGLAKFILWADDAYGWGVGAKAGLVERYLYAHNVAPGAFLPRLILRGLSDIQGHPLDRPPQHVLHVVDDAVTQLRRAIG